MTIYYRLADGALGSRSVSDGEITLPEGAVVLTAEEYQAALDAAEAERAARAETIRAAEREEARTAYEALVANGIADAVARRLSGYYETSEAQ